MGFGECDVLWEKYDGEGEGDRSDGDGVDNDDDGAEKAEGGEDFLRMCLNFDIPGMLWCRLWDL